ncbi:related to potassium channel beta subunit protein [Serendipita indica DSM 11827]|uniref:Related to potassium channel beta subunit protein n=1 Tax=Serendipita indica (strain DSM 11827) TaxID=1109443 RepID=G4TDW2_SERID|nr:related to potassium channel beta subunit protein [Serendipita indica DSM 11827]
MTFGDKEAESARTHSVEEIKAILDVFQKHGHNKIGWKERGLIVDIKLYPIPSMNMRHTPEDLRKTLQASLNALRTDKIELFYLHAPDRSVPWEVTFKAVDDLYKEGKFDKVLLCHVHEVRTDMAAARWEVAEIVTLCRINGWIQPTVYQGIYNAIHRAVEPELFPALRKFGIAFYAYNPLSGGFLTGRYVDATSQVEPGSRFDDSKGTSQSVNYRKRYWNDHNFKALSIIADAAANESLTISEVALRWMSHHSQMKRQDYLHTYISACLMDSCREFGDAVIIGASKTVHLEQNLIDLEKGPLPESIVTAVDKAWRVTAPYVQKYWH